MIYITLTGSKLLYCQRFLSDQFTGTRHGLAHEYGSVIEYNS